MPFSSSIFHLRITSALVGAARRTGPLQFSAGQPWTFAVEKEEFRASRSKPRTNRFGLSPESPYATEDKELGLPEEYKAGRCGGKIPPCSGMNV